jgi:uncharacterized protein
MRQPPAIEAFGGGGFRVAGERFEGSILIVQDAARPWPVREITAIRPEDFEPVIAAGAQGVEFVLLGTGAALTPAPRPVREALRAAGFGLELMNTPEACRLYNYLAAEGRLIAAALIAV